MSTLTQSPVLETAGAHPVAPAAGRIEFLSRYKGFLAIFVVLIHTGITYGAVGGWDFVEKNDVVWLGVLTTWINALAQSFVLGAFFFISAYFLPRSLRKKGHARFLLDRLVKLGIPYAIYYFLGMPFLIAVAEWGRGQPFRLGLYFNSGPLWFIEALFIFTLVYIVVKLFRKDSRPIFLPKGVPSRALIVAYIAAAAVIGFAVRLVYPAGQAIHNLQLGYFPMYVLLFAAGIKAGEEGWLEKIAEMKIGAWIAPAAVCAASFLPLMVLGGALDSGADAFLGGLTWQSAAYAVWDAVGGTSLFIVSIVLFARARWKPSRLGASFGRASFGIYLMHGLVIIPAAVGLHFLPLHPALKWVVLSVAGVCVSWALTVALKKVPGVSKVM